MDGAYSEELTKINKAIDGVDRSEFEPLSNQQLADTLKGYMDIDEDFRVTVLRLASTFGNTISRDRAIDLIILYRNSEAIGIPNSNSIN